MKSVSKNIEDKFMKEETILNFSDFQKQNIKFDIVKLQEAYLQIIKTKNLTMAEVFLILEQSV